MKKYNYILLQLVLSIILIVCGVFISMRTNKSAIGVSVVLMSIPGLCIMGVNFVEAFKFKKYYYYPIAYFTINLVLDILAIVFFKIDLKDSFGYFAFFISIILTTIICELFHIVYSNIKKPR